MSTPDVQEECASSTNGDANQHTDADLLEDKLGPECCVANVAITSG